MTLRPLLPLLGLVALALAGCGKAEEAASAEESPLPKTPNATAADNARNLEHANMPEKAKAVMGGAKPGSN